MNTELTIESVRNFLEQNSFELHGTHPCLCFLIIKRICEKLKNGKRFAPIKVDNGIIVDGHHRFVSYSFLGIQVETQNWTKSLSDKPKPWNTIEIVDIEWDTPEDIEKYNNE